jgi:hypothetical protein
VCHREAGFISRDVVERDLVRNFPRSAWRMLRFKLEWCEGFLSDKKKQIMLRYRAVLTWDNFHVYVQQNESLFLDHCANADGVVLWYINSVHAYDTPDFSVYKAWVAVPTPGDLLDLLVEEEAS